MEVRVLLCHRVLGRFPLVREPADDEAIAFLRNWLSTRESKAVVLLQDWKQFVSEWEAAIGDFPETKSEFFAILRGIITPYRDKYAVEAGVAPDGETTASEDEVGAMRIITRRHYDTCEYLVTYDPGVFRGKGLKLPDERIVTPALFRAVHQPEVDAAPLRGSIL
jgi:hypothetical protein